MTEPTGKEILAVIINDGDGGESTLRECFIALLSILWEEGSGFSSKRPFGNSDWQWDVYAALIKAGHVEGEIDEYGSVNEFDKAAMKAADKLVQKAIQSLNEV